jgi:hypothetical protein
MVQQAFAQVHKQSNVQKSTANGILQRNSKSAILQRYADDSAPGGFGSSALAAESMRCEPKPNRTGMPDGLKAGIESLSGIDLSDVRVHTNSDKPESLDALAYTQGNEIHLGPGQEQYLPHETWHSVQQKQGRVQATRQMNGVGVNDDPQLEREADRMGGRATQLMPVSKSILALFSPTLSPTFPLVSVSAEPNVTIQRVITKSTDDLGRMYPDYLQELSRLDAPGMWSCTNNGAFAVSHRGMQHAVGMSDAKYSSLVKTKERWKIFGSYHFSYDIDLLSAELKKKLEGKTCIEAANYLMHYNMGRDISLAGTQELTMASRNPSIPGFDPNTSRPTVQPQQVPVAERNDNARADLGESYCIVSEPNSECYNFHYGCVVAKKNGEALTAEGFATGSATLPNWSFRVYDSENTFHSSWRERMTKTEGDRNALYPFTFVTKLV